MPDFGTKSGNQDKCKLTENLGKVDCSMIR